MISVFRPWPFTIKLDDITITIDPVNPFTVLKYKVVMERTVRNSRYGAWVMVSEQMMEDSTAFPYIIDELFHKLHDAWI